MNKRQSILILKDVYLITEQEETDQERTRVTQGTELIVRYVYEGQPYVRAEADGRRYILGLNEIKELTENKKIQL
jgi:hypothetical protein